MPFELNPVGLADVAPHKVAVKLTGGGLGLPKQIEVDARIALHGVQVVIHLPSLVVAPEFHGDCSLRNHHFLQATTAHVGVNTLERTGINSTSRCHCAHQQAPTDSRRNVLHPTYRSGPEELDSPLQHRGTTWVRKTRTRWGL